MRHVRTLAAGLLLGLTVSAFAGCSSRDLTREHAKKLIQDGGKQFNLVADDRTTGVGAINLSDNDVEWGMRRGYWTPQNTLLGQQLRLTPAGSTIGLQFGSQGMGSITLRLSRRVRGRVIDVTGISGAQDSSEKIAEFTWQLETANLTPVEQDLLKDRPPVQGKAAFKLYDDGWRLQDVNSHRE